MDHEMPDAKWLNETNVKAALADQSLEIQVVDRALVRRYTQMFRFGQFERPYAPGRIDARANGAVSRRIGEQIAVLLKNDGGVLPLDPAVRSIVVIGQAAYVDEACLGGGGSSKVDPLYTVPPVDGLRDVLDGLGSTASLSRVTVAPDLANLAEARQAAAAADVVVIMAGLVATEGADRPDAHLPDGQDRMIEEIGPVNPRTVVVLKDSNPVLMPWIDTVPAVLEAWNQGAEDGHVVADLLLGVVNPSGKLPTTYPRAWGDTPFGGHPERYPGTDEGDGYPVMRYTEGLRMGYRWYQSQGIAPLFPFGFGLSYTTFALSDLAVTPAVVDPGTPVTVEVTVTNTGRLAGAEVVQVYVALPDDAGEPPRRLVGFRKIHLAPGGSERVRIVVDPQATSHPLSVWDDAAHDFVVVPGRHTLHVGTSCQDTPLTAGIEVTGRPTTGAEAEAEADPGPTHAPVVTLFEHYGAGADEVGTRVAHALGLPYHSQAFSSEELEGGDAGLRRSSVLAAVYSAMGGAYGGFDGGDVVATQEAKYDLVAANNRAVLEMADRGGVIVGRNGTAILARRPRTVHVLLTGSVEDRVARAARAGGIPVEQAARRQVREDAVRAEMSLVLYGWDPRLPDRYDLVVNTSRLSLDAAAEAIVHAVQGTSS
jgi:cytidylate kinase